MSICIVWSQVSPGWVELVCGREVLAEVEVLFGLKKLPARQFASIEEAKLWLVQKETSLARYLALRSLARQALPSTALYQKLRARGFSDAICQQTVLSCQSFLADDEYWPRIVEKELAKGYGPRFIAWKWKAKGIPPHWIEQIATVERQRVAIETYCRKMKSGRDAFRALLQRGFDLDVIREVYRS